MTSSAPRRFDARRATGLLLLLTGSTVGGLTAYWLTPDSRTGQASRPPQGQAQDAASVAEAGSANGWTTGNDGTTPDPWADQGSGQDPWSPPRFSQQPMQAPQGWTRGS
ncbi:hypothetical protein E5F05_19770 [Deinococcus metallilatus]|uniref:Uncharacterized protein n=1 Tax=Deinococcus metallilatus TaxID=1211322 RepID=A0AAJ5F5S3_9DEIO|nr:hypothetical protein [Deinococcus metallilatus]MBB5296338.1 hypothetical protein [Deinococcus metallilatus]QBY09983.1 hypothetical protein E5F05_19770 [Deinococcus metallilatus]RXJ08707.1 hypothetical protein ERJ73_18610 [Deinococcus metallilatus]TLK25181.1 hypothetical protein FCS05_13525 [Deinococcus metallilatus]GMA14749.1 hypothetical protein GCM10025871_10800 [Deinococcus metallilatus]